MKRMLKFKVVISLLFLSLSSFMGLHKYFVSVTDIEYVPKEKAVQIITRLFIDDFDSVLQERYDVEFHLESEATKDTRLAYIQKYFSKKVTISINNVPQKIQLLGTEFEDDMLVSYFEIRNVNAIKSIKITNKLLLENGSNQQNITHININGKKKSFLFVKDKDTDVLNF